MAVYKIIHYEDQHHADFKNLNLEWLDLYGLTEPRDLEVLDDPRSTILEKGGAIFLAQYGDRIVGSAALMKEHGVYELAKMGVSKDHRQKGIGNLLIEKCLEEARERKAKKIILFSNHLLKPALRLYEKYGFKYVVMADSPFVTADIKMELDL